MHNIIVYSITVPEMRERSECPLYGVCIHESSLQYYNHVLVKTNHKQRQCVPAEAASTIYWNVNLGLFTLFITCTLCGVLLDNRRQRVISHEIGATTTFDPSEAHPSSSRRTKIKPTTLDLTCNRPTKDSVSFRFFVQRNTYCIML